MGWGPVIKALVDEQRSDTFESSPQLTLGQLITRLEAIPATHGEDNKLKDVYFDFSWFFPTTLHSWRGSYAELALGFAEATYGERPIKAPTLQELIVLLRDGIGNSYEGWKGGTFWMSENTPIWCDQKGNGSHTGIVGAIDLGYCVIIQTAYCEY